MALQQPERDPALQNLLDQVENDPTGVMGSVDLQMSPELTRLLERGLIGTSLPPVLKDSKAAKAFQQAFDMIGGVPRLALWADQNPTKFYALYSKLVPATAEVDVKKDITITLKYTNPAFNTGPVSDATITADLPPNG
jgi:hypothetical protein